MKYCKNCGVELSDDAVFCPNCGEKQTSDNSNIQSNPTTVSQSTNTVYVTSESSTLGVMAIVCGFLMPFLGLILGIVGLSSYKKKENRNLCKAGIIISIAEFVLYIILIIIYYVFLMGILSSATTFDSLSYIF